MASKPPRLSRGQFILSSGLVSLYSILGLLIVSLIVKLTGSVMLFGLLSAVVSIVALVYFVKISVRRCHDL